MSYYCFSFVIKKATEHPDVFAIRVSLSAIQIPLINLTAFQQHTVCEKALHVSTCFRQLY